MLKVLSRAYEEGGKLLLHGVRKSTKLREKLAKRNGRARMVEGRMLDDTIASLFALDEILGGADLRKFAIPIARARLRSSIAIVDGKGPREVATRDTAANHVRFRTYTPPGLAAPSRAILYFHGGGFVTCDLETHDAFCRRLAVGVSCRVIAVEYRLAPENPFPAPTDDAVYAFRHVVENAVSFEIDPNKLGIAGDSAGGNLSAVVAIKTRGDKVRPAFQVLLYPALDATNSCASHKTFGHGYSLTEDMLEWYYTHYFGNDPVKAKNPDISPSFTEDLTGLPPALVFTAGFDPLRDEGDDYAKRLQKAGVSVVHRSFDSMPHGFALMSQVPAAQRAGNEIIRAIRDAWSPA